MDDKKKKLALLGLFLVIVAVGAFQFTSGSSPAENKSKKPDVAKANEAKIAGSNAMYAETDVEATSMAVVAALPTRDPFDGSAWQPKVEAPKPVVSSPRTSTSVPRPKGRLGGTLPPFDPSGLGQLPNAGGQGAIGLQPGKPMPEIDTFSYSVSGVITGARPAAVVTDSSGNQRLVPLGGAIDGDARIVGISRGQVVVRHKNKTLTLTVGGTSSDQ